ncbi:MAG TPA: DUF2339 domain-containing protein, partial [Burkholderiales bacterium]|nr:DUF2339 domain-containing protein [Burkholderiales bacterium]
MWFLCAIAGAVLGAMVGQLSGFFIGAVLGGLVGAAYERRTRLQELERRLSALEKVLVLSSAPPVPPAKPAESPARAPQFEPTRRVEPPIVSKPPAPPPPAGPRSPNVWERLFGANLVVTVGVIVLFFGVAFLLKYTYERVHVPIELRLSALAAAAVVLLAIGWRLRFSRPGYALVLQGGGVGILYLVIFGAFRLFHLLPATLAFALLVIVAVCSAALSVAQNSLTLAAIGVSGGFLAPLLAS